MKSVRHIEKREFEKLYFDHYSELCASIYRFTRDAAITKDIVQDVFIKYWQKMQEAQTHNSPIAYLKRACINQALNYLKEKERRAQREQIYSDQSTASSRKEDQPDVEYQQKETAKKIQTAIDELPLACRNTFLLSRYEQKSYKEIANLLDISVNTVEKHIGKALKTLRSILRDADSSPSK